MWCSVAAVKRLPVHRHGAVYILFWSFEISGNILRNQKQMIDLDSYSRQVFIYLDSILIYISLWIDRLFKIRKIAGCLQGHWWGFISRNYVVWPSFFLMNVFMALKGSHFLVLSHQNTIQVHVDSNSWRRHRETYIWLNLYIKLQLHVHCSSPMVAHPVIILGT